MFILIFFFNFIKNLLSSSWFESKKIWAAGLVVEEYCNTPSHWRNVQTLSEWMEKENIPGIQGIDTRELTKKIREKGTILGKIVHNLPVDINEIKINDPNARNLVQDVSIMVSLYSENALGTLLQFYLIYTRNL